MKARSTPPNIEQEQRRVDKHNRRALNRGQTATLTLRQWLYILHHFNWRCAYCRGQFQSIDHIIPIGEGGGTTVANCVPACQSCNDRRSHLATRAQTLQQELGQLQQSCLIG